MDYIGTLSDVRDMEARAWDAMGQCPFYEITKFGGFVDDCRDLIFVLSQRLKEQECATREMAASLAR